MDAYESALFLDNRNNSNVFLHELVDLKKWYKKNGEKRTKISSAEILFERITKNML